MTDSTQTDPTTTSTTDTHDCQCQQGCQALTKVGFTVQLGCPGEYNLTLNADGQQAEDTAA